MLKRDGAAHERNSRYLRNMQVWQGKNLERCDHKFGATFFGVYLFERRTVCIQMLDHGWFSMCGFDDAFGIYVSFSSASLIVVAQPQKSVWQKMEQQSCPLP